MYCIEVFCLKNQFLRLQFWTLGKMFFKLDVPIARVNEKIDFCNQDLNTIFRINFFFRKQHIYCKITKMSSNVSEKSITNGEIQTKLFVFRKDYQLWNALKNLEKRPEIMKIIRGYPLENYQKTPKNDLSKPVSVWP